MKSLKQIRAVFLILLLGGSFFLHTFVHHASCCGSDTGLQVCTDAPTRILPDSCAADPIELFCPVCAGLMNTVPPPAEERLSFSSGSAAVFSAISDQISTPAWLRPSPRGPPIHSLI